MTVRRVFAQADVCDQHEVTSLQLAERALDDTVLVPRSRSLLVLLVRNAEEDHALDAESLELVSLCGERLDGVAGQARQLGIRQRLGADKERHDEVVEIEPRLAHEPAQPGRPPQPTQPGHRKGAHRYSVTLGLSGSEPQTVRSGRGHPSPLGRYGLLVALSHKQAPVSGSLLPAAGVRPARAPPRQARRPPP